ncbi:MAG TPA: YceI family protein [Granulicella sp.]|jgi:polyisoprenoid-binding protein YceI|nr:YceI family protein [Granulicella sp.]
MLKKLLRLFEATALLTICVGFLANLAAAQHNSKPGQKAAAAQALPAPGTYQIDGDHSFAFFGARHHVIGLVRGRFDKVLGTITVSQNLTACSVDITIDVSSISTQVHERDEDLLSPAYFDVKKFPTMTYQGRGIRHISDNSWTMDGSLTIHGVTKVVPLTFISNGMDLSVQRGNPARASFHASAATKRADFGMGGRDNLLELGDATTPDVQIEIDVEMAEIGPKHRGTI